tara:strand:- start:11536 stop:12066 length:531 start_codon:yes stop_codon:yes gene_type:complete
MNTSKIRDITDWLRSEYSLGVPVNVEWLSKSLGIEVKRDDLSELSLSGFAVHKNGKRYIGVHGEEPLARQRFTIAHELGHLFLHKNESVSYDQGGMMLFREEHAGNGGDAKEVEANKFAAELLMPEAELREDTSKEGSFDLINRTSATDEIIARLAEKYEVSEQAMTIRLTTLYFG